MDRRPNCLDEARYDERSIHYRAENCLLQEMPYKFAITFTDQGEPTHQVRDWKLENSVTSVQQPSHAITS